MQFVSSGAFRVSTLNLRTQLPHHRLYYGRLNLIWQLRKRLSIGVEGLYGRKETEDGDTGDVFRAQVGMVYSLFD